MNIAKIMIPKVSTVYLYEGSTVREGLEIMKRNGYTAIPVLNNAGEYLGSVTEGDFLRHMLAVGSTDERLHETYKVGEILRREFCRPLSITASRQEVIDALLQQNFVPIVDDRGFLCGIITRRSVIAYLAEQEQAEQKTE